MLTHWSQLVPKMSADIPGHEATQQQQTGPDSVHSFCTGNKHSQTHPEKRQKQTKTEKRKKKRSVIIIARKEKSAVVMDLGTKGSVYRNNLF